MVWERGFEPPTSRSQSERSNRTELLPDMVARVSVALTTLVHDSNASLEFRAIWWLRLVSHQVPFALQANALLLSYEAKIVNVYPIV